MLGDHRSQRFSKLYPTVKESKAFKTITVFNIHFFNFRRSMFEPRSPEMVVTPIPCQLIIGCQDCTMNNECCLTKCLSFITVSEDRYTIGKRFVACKNFVVRFHLPPMLQNKENMIFQFCSHVCPPKQELWVFR